MAERKLTVRFIPTRENSAHAAFQLMPEQGERNGGMTPGRKLNHGQGTDVDVRRGESPVPLGILELTIRRGSKSDLHLCSERRDVPYRANKSTSRFFSASTATITIPPRTASQTNDFPYDKHPSSSWQSSRIIGRAYTSSPLPTSSHGQFSGKRKGRFTTLSSRQPTPLTYACTHNTYIWTWSSARSWSLVIALSSASITSRLDFGTE